MFSFHNLKHRETSSSFILTLYFPSYFTYYNGLRCIILLPWFGTMLKMLNIWLPLLHFQRRSKYTWVQKKLTLKFSTWNSQRGESFSSLSEMPKPQCLYCEAQFQHSGLTLVQGSFVRTGEFLQHITGSQNHTCSITMHMKNWIILVWGNYEESI